MNDFTGIWIPAEILAIADMNLTEKILASQVLMLSRTGECTAKNRHLSTMLGGLSETSISQTLKNLRTKEYICIEDGQLIGNKRTMYPSIKLLHTLCKNLTEGWEKQKTPSVRILQSLYKILTEATQDSYTPYIRILQTLFKNLTEPYIRTESKEESKVESKRESAGDALGECNEITSEEKGKTKPPPAPAPPPKKEREHLFANSEFADKEKFRCRFAGTDYEVYDLDFYYEQIKNWSAGKGAKKIDWIATARSFMLSDTQKGIAKQSPNFQPINPSPHATTANYRTGNNRAARPSDAEFALEIDALAKLRYGGGGN